MCRVTRDKPVGVILAGGLSSRFGSDKASALLRGKPLLAWVAAALAEVCPRLVVVVARGQQLPPLEAPLAIEVVIDRYDRMGPLAGMTTAFEHLGSGVAFVAACDVPLLQSELVAGLLCLADRHDVVCPKTGDALQPLVAAYRAETCLPVFRRRVEEGRLKVIDAFEELDVRYVADAELVEFDPNLRSFLNANQPEGLAPLEAELAGEVGPRPWGAVS